MLSISRPGILVRAARAGLAYYRAEKELPFLLRTKDIAQIPDPQAALVREEAEINACRFDHSLTYDLKRHIRILTAIIAGATTAP
jgi:hypothetical protein